MPHTNRRTFSRTFAPEPSVVVVIPFYNGASFVERALQSVFDQTRPANEVIVVNDGSRPEEREALGLLAERYPFRIIDKENGGQGSARNAGVAASSADYICFLDQDDFYLPNHNQSLVDAIPKDDQRFGFVYADLYEANGEGNVLRTSLLKAPQLSHLKHPKTNIFEMLRHDMYVLPSATLVSRIAFEAVGGFDPQFTGYEDDDLFLRIFRKGYSNHFIDRAVAVWCIHTESTSFNIRMDRSRLRYFKKLVATFPDEPRMSRFYLRDYLSPKFGRFFIDSAVGAIWWRSEHRDEVFSCLNEYVEIVLANPYAGRRLKFRLRLTRFLLAHGSPGLFRVGSFVTRLPFLGALRRLYRSGD